MTIEWANFAAVAGAALVTTIVLAGFCSGGVRLLSDGRRTGAAPKVAAAWACFAVCAAAVLFGLWLVVPQFHG